MIHTGERQTGKTIDLISPDHKNRYLFSAQFFQKINAFRVLDVGCGIGYGSNLLGERGISTIGIDNSRDAINEALTYYWRQNISFVCHDALTWPGYSAGWDAIVCFEFLEHIETPRVILEHLTTASPWIVASVPNEEVIPLSSNPAPFHFRHYTPKEFDDMFADTGWKVEGRYCQKDKRPGIIVDGTDGRNLVYIASRLRIKG